LYDCVVGYTKLLRLLGAGSRRSVPAKDEAGRCAAILEREKLVESMATEGGGRCTRVVVAAPP
jgi:hypothetical protein